MSETQKKAYLVAAAMAILHNGVRYEQGDKIELTDDEAEKISLYIALDEDEAARQQAEAEKQRLAAEKAAEEAAEKEAKAKAEAEKKAQETAKKRGQADKVVQDNKDKDEQ
nr:MAG TPA: hypothetical protein [Caudoviricetes sp.]